MPYTAGKSIASLVTCRQMRAEASLLYYRMTTFTFRSTAHVTSFTNAAGTVHCCVIKSVYIWLQAHTISAAKIDVQTAPDECLRGFPELENV